MLRTVCIAQPCVISQFTGDIIVGFASEAKEKSKSNDRYDIHTGCGEKGMVLWVAKVT